MSTFPSGPADPKTIDEELVATLVGEIGPRLQAVQDRIRQAGGERVQLLAVSKTKPAEAVVAGLRLGLDTFGENYAQELVAKAAVVATAPDTDPFTWHFIGQLQSNKVKLAAEVVDTWQSVDRAKLGTTIAKRQPGATVFAEVNLADDTNKAGCSFAELDGLVEHLIGLGLNVDGLMGVGTAGDERATAAAFARLRRAVDRHELRHCSMGMTDDLELAIAEGSTMVRIGTAIFGARGHQR